MTRKLKASINKCKNKLHLRISSTHLNCEQLNLRDLENFLRTLRTSSKYNLIYYPQIQLYLDINEILQYNNFPSLRLILSLFFSKDSHSMTSKKILRTTQNDFCETKYISFLII